MSAREMETVLDEGHNLVKNGKPFAIVSVVEYKGHNARHEGSIMLVKEDGTIVGTVGGAALEKFSIEKSLEYIKENKSGLIDIGPTSSLGMVCGGSVKIYIKSVGLKDTLIIFGAGHVAIALNKLAKMMGYNVIIVDERQEWANREKFPEADKIILEQPEKAIEMLPSGPNAYVVLTSYSGEIEKSALKLLLPKEYGYVGLISSPVKALEFLEYLSNYFDVQTLKSIKAPMGLDIGGGEVPAEIALSVISEIQMQKYKGTGAPLSKTDQLLERILKKKQLSAVS